jgi:flagellar hook-basal body complex protein FliE
MAIDPLSPLANAASPGSAQFSKPAAQPTDAPDFASVLSSLASGTASSIKTGEELAIKGLQGQAPVQDVVQAVMKAQTSLQTALAIRDKAVSAYQDLIRMPI